MNESNTLYDPWNRVTRDQWCKQEQPGDPGKHHQERDAVFARDGFDIGQSLNPFEIQLKKTNTMHSEQLEHLQRKDQNAPDDPRQENNRDADHADELGNKGQRLILDRGNRLDQTDQKTNDHPHHQQRVAPRS